MSINQIRQALGGAYAATNRKMDIIGFDACLMGCAEVAYNVAPYADYLVASEDLEPGHGWDYQSIINGIVSNRTIGGAALGRVICDGYKAQADQKGAEMRAAGKAYNGEQTITLSVVDLSKVTGVTNALDSLGSIGYSNLISNGMTSWGPIAINRGKSPDYGNSIQTSSFLDMVDIQKFATNLQSIYPSQASTLSTAVSQAVVYKVGGSQRADATGLSVFMPYQSLQGSPMLSSLMSNYAALNFPTNWRNMVSQYVAAGTTDTTGPSFINMTFVGGDTIQATLSSTDTPSDQLYTMITQTDPVGNSLYVLGLDPVDSVSGSESPRVCRRLHLLRGWGYEQQTDTVSQGST